MTAPRILVAFERSGRVRRAFALRGWHAVSCDLVPSDLPCGLNESHAQCDALALAEREPWDLMIAFPPCTYLAISGLHWNARRPERVVRTEGALVLVRRLLDLPIPKIALENPVGLISSAVREPDQIIQPFQFGDDASKATCLWLKGLPPLRPTCAGVLPRVPRIGRRRWSNQTDSGQNRLPPSPDRARRRALTYRGIADAMADQWGNPDLVHRAPEQVALPFIHIFTKT